MFDRLRPSILNTAPRPASRGRRLVRTTARSAFTVACMVLIATASLLSEWSVVFAATPPNILSYQGRILNSNGVPVANASANMQFRLFDALAAGTCLWSNDSSTCVSDADIAVTLTDGLFSENLGDTGDGYAAIADTVFADNASVFLEVEIEGEVLSPRKRVTSAAYAMNANTLDGFDSADFASVTSVFLQNGNSFGATAVLGTNDSNDLQFETDGTTWETISTTGQRTLSADTNYTLSGGVNGLSFDGTTFSVDATNDRIGIGLAAPTARLHIENTAAENSFQVDDAAGDTTPFSIDQDGNVLVGTTAVSSGAGLVFDADIDGNDVYAEGSIAAKDRMFADTFHAGHFNVGVDETRYGAGLIESTGTQDITINPGGDDINILNNRITGTTAAIDFTNFDVGTSGDVTSVSITTGDLGVTGSSTLGTTSADNVTFAADINSDILPNTDDTFTLGDADQRWADLFLGPSTLHIGTNTTDEGTISYNTGSDILEFDTDSTTNADIAFFTDDLYIDKSTGFVGVGTDTPGAQFSIAGGVQQDPTGTLSITDTLVTASMDGPAAIATSGTYAYVTGFTADSLTIFDISDPTNIFEISSVTDATNLNFAGPVAVSGSYAYVGESLGTTITVVDISDPFTPTVVGTVNAAFSNIRATVVSGPFLYAVFSSNDALVVIDISNPTLPRIIGSLTDATQLDGASSAFVQGTYLYVTAESTDRLTIVDVSDPEAPSIVGSVADSTNLDRAKDVVVRGSIAYVGTLFTGMRLTTVDVSDPTTPVVLDSVSTGSSETATGAIDVFGRYAVTTGSQADRISLVDISDPNDLVLINQVSDSVNLDGAQDVTVVGNHAYVIGINANSINSIDLEGQIISSLESGSIFADTLSVRGAIRSSDSAYFGGGVTVGTNGLYSTGATTIAGPNGTIGLHIVQQTVDDQTTAISNQAFVIDVNEVASSDEVFMIRSDADGTPDTEFRFENDGDAFADGAFTGAGADVAEFFPTSDRGLVPGTVMCLDPDRPFSVIMCSPSARVAVGVISTNPAFIGNNIVGAEGDLRDDPNYALVGLLGQVPTRVSTSAGSITIGDALTPSVTALGVAQKAAAGDMIIGYALETLTEGTQSIPVLVRPSGVPLDPSSTTSASTVSGNLSSLNLNGDIYVQGNSILNVGRITGLSDAWSIDADGTLRTEGAYIATIESYQGDMVETAAVLSPEHKILISGNGTLENGIATVVFNDVYPGFSGIISAESRVEVVAMPMGPVSLYVEQKDRNGFTVRQIGGADSGIAFDWIATGIRKGYEGVGLPVEESAEEDVSEDTPADTDASDTEDASSADSETSEEPPEESPEEPLDETPEPVADESSVSDTSTPEENIDETSDTPADSSEDIVDSTDVTPEEVIEEPPVEEEAPAAE